VGIELPSLAEAALADGRLLLEVDRVVREGLADRRAAFELRLEQLPVHFGFAVVCGVHTFHDRLASSTVNPAAFTEAARLLGLADATAARLQDARFAVDVDALPEGTLVFPGEAIATLEGTLFEVLLAATVSLPLLRRAGSIATRAARLALAADGDVLVEAASTNEATREQAALVARAAFVGGCDATTNPIASALAELPLRAAASRALASLVPPAAPRPDPEGWSSLPAESWTVLERGDEEAALLELRRCGNHPTGWIVTSFDGPELTLRCDLVALEEEGAWRPSNSSSAPGRKIAVRYADAMGHPLRDVVYLADERIREASAFDAASFETLASPVLRQGRAVAASELPRDARLRARAARLRAPTSLLHLRHPGTFPVDVSEGVRSIAAPPRRGSRSRDGS
jgi:nicotinic acid phosphoribosyltransferase